MASLLAPAVESDFRFATGEVVLVKWGDGKLYYAKIRRIDRKAKKCVILFDDNSRGEAHFSQIHSVTETTTEIVCIVCKGEVSEAPDEIVLCDKCGVGYHQHCHLPNIPDTALKEDEPWECTYCLRTVTNPHVFESMNPFVESQRRGFRGSPPPAKKRRMFGATGVWLKYGRAQEGKSGHSMFSSPSRGPRSGAVKSADTLVVGSFSSPPNLGPIRSGSESSAIGEESEAPLEVSDVTTRSANVVDYEREDWGGDEQAAGKRSERRPSRKGHESESAVTSSQPDAHGTASDKRVQSPSVSSLRRSEGEVDHPATSQFDFHQSTPVAQESAENSTDIVASKETTSVLNKHPGGSATGKMKRFRTVHQPRTRTPNRATGKISVFMKKRLEKTGTLQVDSLPSRNSPIMASRAPRFLPKLRPDNYDMTSTLTEQDLSPTEPSGGGGDGDGTNERESVGLINNVFVSSSTVPAKNGSRSPASDFHRDGDIADDESLHQPENMENEEVELDAGNVAVTENHGDDDGGGSSGEGNDLEEYYLDGGHLADANSLDRIPAPNAVNPAESGESAGDDDVYPADDDVVKNKARETSQQPSHARALDDSPVSSASSSSSTTQPIGAGKRSISATATWCPEKPLTLEMLKQMSQDQKQQHQSQSQRSPGSGHETVKSQLPEVPALSRSRTIVRRSSTSGSGEESVARKAIRSAPKSGSSSSAPPWDADLRSFTSLPGQINSEVEFQKVRNKIAESRRRKQNVSSNGSILERQDSSSSLPPSLPSSAKTIHQTTSAASLTAVSILRTSSAAATGHRSRPQPARSELLKKKSSAGIIEYSSRELQEQSLEQLFADVNKRMRAEFDGSSGAGNRPLSREGLGAQEPQILSVESIADSHSSQPASSVTVTAAVLTSTPPVIASFSSRPTMAMPKPKRLVIAASSYDKRYAEMDQATLVSTFETCFASFGIPVHVPPTPSVSVSVSTASEQVVRMKQVPRPLPSTTHRMSPSMGSSQPVTTPRSVAHAHFQAVHSPNSGGVVASPRHHRPYPSPSFELAVQRSVPPPSSPQHHHSSGATVVPQQQQYVPQDKYDAQYGGHHVAPSAATATAAPTAIVQQLPPQPSHMHVVQAANPRGPAAHHPISVSASGNYVMSGERIPVMVSSPPSGHQVQRNSMPVAVPHPPPQVQPASAVAAAARGRRRIPDPGPHFCRVCANIAAYLCSGCQRAWYCSPHCQMSDWVQHSKLCDHNK